MNHIKNHIKENYTMIPNELIRQEGLNPIAKYIFGYLASMADGWEFKTHDLVKRLDLNKKTFVKYRDQLVKEGWLFVEPQGKAKNGIFLPKVYHILSKKGAEISKKPTVNQTKVDPFHPSTIPSVADGNRDEQDGSHKNKKAQREEESQEEDSFLNSDFENFNPNPRIN